MFWLILFTVAIVVGFGIASIREQGLPKKHITWYFKYIYLPTLEHCDALLNAYIQGRRIGDYGELVDDYWRQEVRYFVRNVILPNMPETIDTSFKRFAILKYSQGAETAIEDTRFQRTIFKFSDYVDIEKIEKEPQFLYTYLPQWIGDSRINVDDCIERIEDMVRYLCNGLFGNLAPEQKTDISPLKYELYIAAELRNIGFQAKVTKASGDQGADVLATKNGVSFAIQCKKYSKPVGNKAVQEANAGRDFYKKDFGVVVSNAGFTKSAKQAAHACGIILLNDKQLDSLLKYTDNQPAE